MNLFRQGGKRVNVLLSFLHFKRGKIHRRAFYARGSTRFESSYFYSQSLKAVRKVICAVEADGAFRLDYVAHDNGGFEIHAARQHDDGRVILHFVNGPYTFDNVVFHDKVACFALS